MSAEERPLVWLHGEIRTPPFSPLARREAGYLLRLLQVGETLSLPRSRPMPAIGARCHELRIVDRDVTWRIVVRLDPDAVLVLEVFAKTTRATPEAVLEACQRRLAAHDRALRRSEV